MRLEITGDTDEVKILSDILDEIDRAKVHGDKYASLHEAYAVLAEEVDEVWDIVKQKKSKRSAADLRAELNQVAAVAIKMIGSMDQFVEAPKDPLRFAVLTLAINMFHEHAGRGRCDYVMPDAWYNLSEESKQKWYRRAREGIAQQAKAQP